MTAAGQAVLRALCRTVGGIVTSWKKTQVSIALYPAFAPARSEHAGHALAACALPDDKPGAEASR